MRVFLSAYSGFTLAIPMDVVASMMLYDQKPEKVVQYDQKSRNTYVSFPRLFKLDEEAVHGIVLREWNSKVNKVVLATAEIKRDIEIPDNEFHPMPKSLGSLRFSKIFRGIKFSDKPILLLNIEQMTQLIQEEQYVINTKTDSPKQPLSEPPPEQQPLSEEPLPEEQPLAEEPLPEEQPLAEEPPPEAESQVEQPLPQEPPPTVAFEIEPLTEQLVLEELPSQEPPSAAVSEVEPLTDPLVLKELPSEEPLIEEPPSAATSEIEPLTDLLMLSEVP